VFGICRASDYPPMRVEGFHAIASRDLQVGLDVLPLKV